MKREDWKYEVRLIYQHGDRHREGIKMHFHTLADATRKILTISSDAFMARRNTGSYVTGPIAEAQVLFTQTTTPELVVKLRNVNDIDKNITPGLYYNFTAGIESFEQKSGISFSQYKGYDPSLTSILVAYSVQEMGHSIKDGLAHIVLQNDTINHLRNESFYRLELTYQCFGNGGQVDRSVQTTPYVEAFYYNKVDNAVKDLLAIDFNKLDEHVAWEYDMKEFYSRVVLYKNEKIIAKLFVVKPGFARLPGDRFTPGIYLELANSEHRDEIVLLFNKLTSVNIGQINLRVGNYIDVVGRTEKVPELEVILSPKLLHTTIKSKPPASPKKTYKKRRGKGL